MTYPLLSPPTLTDKSSLFTSRTEHSNTTMCRSTEIVSPCYHGEAGQSRKMRRQHAPYQRQPPLTEHSEQQDISSSSGTSGYGESSATHMSLHSGGIGALGTGALHTSHTISDLLANPTSLSDEDDSSHSSGISSAHRTYSVDSSPTAHRPASRLVLHRQYTIPPRGCDMMHNSTAATEVDRHFNLARIQHDGVSQNCPRKVIMVESGAHYTARHKQGVYPMDSLDLVRVKSYGHHRGRGLYTVSSSELANACGAQRSASVTHHDLFVHAFGGMFQ